MEYGATELTLALQAGGLPSGLPHSDPMYYLTRAAHWARQYMGTADQDSLNLYDVAGIAHGDLADAITAAGTPAGLQITRAALIHNLQRKVAGGAANAASDPFGSGVTYGTWDETPHALGLAYEAGEYDRLTHTSTYQAFGKHQLDWVLGRNAWGSSFVVGAGRTFPNCMQNQIANLSGSLNGTPPLELGATVDGPNPADVFTDLGLPGGARSCPANGSDRYRPFNARGARYMDDARAWPSVEPTLDYTALGVLLFANRALG
jgi:endoglucanase